MQKNIRAALIVFFIGLFIGCSKEKEAPATPMLTPSETMLKLADALNHHDSATYVDLISDSRKRMYAASPRLLSTTLSFWSTHHPMVQVISESQQGTTATVNYRLRVVLQRLIDTNETAGLVLEGGRWKYTR